MKSLHSRVNELERRAQGIGGPRAKTWRIVEQHSADQVIDECGPDERLVVVELFHTGDADGND